jgi:ferritin-like metal-binding protein YciE
MNVPYLMEMLERKLSSLGSLKTAAEMTGDVERVLALDSEIEEVKNTLNKLRAVA